MDWGIKFSDKVDGVGHIEHPNLLFSDDIPLPIVDVADAAICQFIKLEFRQAHSRSPVLLLKTCCDGQRRSMSVATLRRVVCVDVGVCIDPDYVQIFVFLE